MTVSAVAKLIPNPPARVDSKNMNCCAPGALNLREIKIITICTEERQHIIIYVSID